jgi:hypothetical protein
VRCVTLPPLDPEMKYANVVTVKNFEVMHNNFNNNDVDDNYKDENDNKSNNDL